MCAAACAGQAVEQQQPAAHIRVRQDVRVAVGLLPASQGAAWHAVSVGSALCYLLQLAAGVHCSIGDAGSGSGNSSSAVS